MKKEITYLRPDLVEPRNVTPGQPLVFDAFTPQEEVCLNKLVLEWVDTLKKEIDFEVAYEALDVFYRNSSVKNRPPRENVFIVSSPSEMEAKFKEVAPGQPYHGSGQEAGTIESWVLIAFYEFFGALGAEYTDEFFDFLNYAKYGGVHTHYLCEEFAILCSHPKETHLKETEEGNFILHRDGGPAVVWKTGECKYVLNGITVPQYLAETPAEDLDLEFFKAEQNADVKTEFINKYGIERMCELGNLIDHYSNYPDNEVYQRSEYALYDMSPIFSQLTYAGFLLMKHQTMDMYCMEGVDNAKTIGEAHNYRAQVDLSAYEIIDVK